MDGLERLQVRAQEKGGGCLSTEYVGMRAYDLFECPQGHQWRAVGNEIMRGNWCAPCARKASGVITVAAHFYHEGLPWLQEAARQHGGECLATEYTGVPKKYTFRCARGDEWEAVASRIWLGQWCPDMRETQAQADDGRSSAECGTQRRPVPAGGISA